MPKIAFSLLLAGAALLAGGVSGQAAALAVPNHSFEQPATEFASPVLSAWQKTPKPDWYPENPETPERHWINQTGAFKNTAADDPAHKDNIDGQQALFLVSVPTVGIFQDYDSVDLLNPVPTRAFDERFEIGKSYALTVGIIGGGGGMPVGASLMLALYYRDAQNNQVPVASTTVVHGTETFPTTTHFVDFTAAVPPVKAGDAWAGQRMGILLVSTTAQDKVGGYWDIDNVRLTSAVSQPTVPNHSFELPPTDFASPVLASWQKTPKPDWYPENPETPERHWINQTGAFKNTPVGDAAHKDNIDGNQALFLVSVPTVGIFQDYDSVDILNPVPTHAFDAKFEVGRAPRLTVGVIGGGGGMPLGATMMMALYYRDAAGQQVPVASTTIAHSTEAFPNLTHFVDFTAEAPVVAAADPWAGKSIGILLVSTTAQDKIGGYWDLDNVRLTFVEEPASPLALAYARVGSDLRISWATEAGMRYQLKVSTGLSAWNDVETAVAGTGGEVAKLVPLGANPHAFFSVVAAPEP